jgi:hypothetical protein
MSSGNRIIGAMHENPSAVAAATGARKVHQVSSLVDRYSEPNLPQFKSLAQIEAAHHDRRPPPIAPPASVRDLRLRVQRARLRSVNLQVPLRRTCGHLPEDAKAASHSNSAAKNSAVVASIALQHGVPVEIIRKTFLRDAHGRVSSPPGCALDFSTGERRP